MTTNGNGDKAPSKPATLENLRTARANWKATTTREGLVDEFTIEMIHEAADSDMGVMAQESRAALGGMDYLDVLEVLAKVGMWQAEQEG